MHWPRMHLGEARPGALRGITRKTLWGLMVFPVFVNLAGCGGDDPVQPQTTVDIAVTKSVDNATPAEGSDVVYTVVVSNAGPAGASGVEVVDTLPPGLTFQSATTTQGTYADSSGAWSVGSVGNGGSATLTLTAMLDAGTAGLMITNRATLNAVAEDDSDSSNDTDTADLISQHVKNVDLAITKSVDDETPTEGNDVVFTVALSNAGPDSASAIEVTDVLPAGLTYQSASATQGTYDPGTGVWDVGDVANGGAETLTLNVTVNEGTGGTTITNRASVSSVAENDTDSNNDSDKAAIISQNHVLVLAPVKDNTLYQDAAGAKSNGAGEFMFSGRTNAPVGVALRRCLVAFDLSALPAGAVVESVELTLTVSKAAMIDAFNFKVHRVLANWFEGTSDAGGRSPSNGGGGGAGSTTGDATWIHTAFPNSFWNNRVGGGDFRAFEAATIPVGPPGAYTWSGNGLRDDVLFWLQNPSSNFGWMLIGNEVVAKTAKRFDTSENTDGTGPQLAITFALP